MNCKICETEYRECLDCHDCIYKYNNFFSIYCRLCKRIKPHFFTMDDSNKPNFCSYYCATKTNKFSQRSNETRSKKKKRK